jgi:hypothetical protein
VTLRLTLLAALAAALLATAASASAPLPRILDCSGKPLLRPTGTLVLSCADANSEIRKTRWSSWGRTSAVGTTDLGLNLCNPNCASSKMSFFPGSRVRLSGVKQTKLGLLFTRVTVSYVLHGKTKVFVGYPPTSRLP